MITIAILAAALVTSVMAGAIVLLRVGIGREESEECLFDEPPTRTAAVTPPRRRPVRAHARAGHSAR